MGNIGGSRRREFRFFSSGFIFFVVLVYGWIFIRVLFYWMVVFSWLFVRSFFRVFC